MRGTFKVSFYNWILELTCICFQIATSENYSSTICFNFEKKERLNIWRNSYRNNIKFELQKCCSYFVLE